MIGTFLWVGARLHVRKVSLVQMLSLRHKKVLPIHARDIGKPFLCFFNTDKAFDSVKIPILLKWLYSIGINGKTLALAETVVFGIFWQSKSKWSLIQLLLQLLLPLSRCQKRFSYFSNSVSHSDEHASQMFT